MKLLLLFSEGPHDVAFIKLVLELGLNIKHIEHVRINDFPNPLNKIFMQILKEHFVDDVALEMVLNGYYKSTVEKYPRIKRV